MPAEPRVSSTASKAKAAELPARSVAPLDQLVCDGCGRSFVTTDGLAMLRVIKGGCPDCGGGFALVSLLSDDDE